MLPHLTNHRPDTFSSMKGLRKQQKLKKNGDDHDLISQNLIRNRELYQERKLGPEVDEVTISEYGVGFAEFLVDKIHDRR